MTGKWAGLTEPVYLHEAVYPTCHPHRLFRYAKLVFTYTNMGAGSVAVQVYYSTLIFFIDIVFGIKV